MGKAGGSDLAAIGAIAAIRHKIDAELALRRLDRRVHFAGGHVIAFCIKLEVMDQRFHRAFHLGALRRHHLWFSTVTGPCSVVSFSQHCFMMRTDWRISSMRTR